MTRAQSINASKPAVEKAVVALYPNMGVSQLQHVTGAVAVYLHDKNYPLSAVFFPSIVEDAIAGYDEFMSQF